MKEINFGTLCELLKEGLSEEVQFDGQVRIFVKNDLNGLFFDYLGEASLKPGTNFAGESVSREGNKYYLLTCGDNHTFYLTQREEIQTNTQGTTGMGPEIIIPLNINPEATLNINRPIKIRY